MPTFEDCKKCGELRIEHYGAVTENKCVECAALERQALTKMSGTIAPDSQQAATIDDVQFLEAEQRRQVQIMTLITGQVDDCNSLRECNILDISKTGAKLQTPHELQSGVLTLAFPGAGTLHATPAWQDGFIAGVTFIEPHDDVVAIIGKAMPLLEPLLRAA